MTTRTLARLGLGATVGAAACALLTTGLVAPTSFVARTAPLFALPRAAAEELPAFADCEQLRRWYVDRALPLVGP